MYNPTATAENKKWAFADWKSSGIAQSLIDANLQIFGETNEGEEGSAVDLILYSENLPRTQSSGSPVSGYKVRQYSHLNDGGWYCPTLDYRTNWESDSDWGCFKPVTTRKDLKTGKVIKYEHPNGEATEVFYLKVPADIWLQVALRYGVKIEGDNFWQWVRDNNIPIWITEGAKKAAALLTHGYAAIALPGVWSGFEKTKTTKGEDYISGIRDCIKAIGLAGREFVVAFDFDSKKSTQTHVAKAASKLAMFLRKDKAQVKFLILGPAKDGGKQGVDDYLVDHPSDGDFAGCKFSGSPSVKDLWALSKWPAIRVSVPKLGNLKDHLGYNLSDASGLYVIKSGTGTGKTDSIGGIKIPDINVDVPGEVASFVNQGRRVIVFTNRTSTGRELARRFGVTYVDDRDGDASSYGIALCIESCKPFGKAGVKVTRVSQDGEPLDSEWLNDCVVILDEFDQTLAQMLTGQTCRKDRGWLLTTFKSLLQDVLGSSEGLVIAMSADITDVEVEYIVDSVAPVKEITPTVLINEWKPDHKYSLYSYPSQADVYDKALEILNSKSPEQCLFFSVEGQRSKTTWGTRTIARKLAEDRPDLSVLQLDAFTLQLKGHPACGCIERINELAREYDVIVASPSISSAVSLDEKGRWIAVCDVSAALNHPREYRQRLDRVRDGVDRHCFIPKSGTPLANGLSFWMGVEEGNDKKYKGILNLLNRIDTADLEARTCPVAKRAWAKQIARFNQDIYQYRESCHSFLKSEGVEVIETDNLEIDDIKALSKAFKELKDDQWEEHADARVKAEILNKADFDEIDGLGSKTLDQSFATQRYLVSRDFGGLEELTTEMIQAHDKGDHKKWKLHYYLERLDYAQFSDTQEIDAIAKKPVIHAPDINSWKYRVWMLERLGVRALMTGDDLTAQSPQVLTLVEKVHANATELKGLFGTKINKKCTPIQLAQSILGLMGLKLTFIKKHRVNGKEQRIYSFDPPMDKRGLIFEYWDKEMELKTADCDTLAESSPETATPLQNPLPSKGLSHCDTLADCDTLLIIDIYKKGVAILDTESEENLSPMQESIAPTAPPSDPVTEDPAESEPVTVPTPSDPYRDDAISKINELTMRLKDRGVSQGEIDSLTPDLNKAPLLTVQDAVPLLQSRLGMTVRMDDRVEGPFGVTGVVTGISPEEGRISILTDGGERNRYRYGSVKPIVKVLEPAF